MKSLPQSLQDHLDTGATTLCWCWRITRRDAIQLGFTDHDRTLEFDGTRFEPNAGLDASEMNERVGLSVDSLEVGGAITSDSLSGDDLAAGRYDDAKVEIFRVNWRDVTQRVLMRAGSLGEVKRAGNAFTAEVRGLSHYLQQPKGRLFQYTCDVHLGSAKCGIDLTTPTYSATATIGEIQSDRGFNVALSGTYQDGWFTRGLATFTTGASSGFAAEVRVHAETANGAFLELWAPPVSTVTPGDELRVTAGCDKHLETCRGRFANAVNFRGFPHMPGNDFVSSYVRRQEA